MGKWINDQFKRGSMNKAKFDRFHKIIVRINRLNPKCRKVVKYRYSARAWNHCKGSRGGILSKSEWRRCSTKLMRKCNLKRFAAFFNKQFQTSMTRARFDSLYHIIVRRFHPIKCRKVLTPAERAFKLCDKDGKGRISQHEWDRCKNRVFKRTILTKYHTWINYFRGKNNSKSGFYKMYKILARWEAKPTSFFKVCRRHSWSGKIRLSDIKRCGPKIWKTCTLRKAWSFIYRTLK
jgi:hypothetical protein